MNVFRILGDLSHLLAMILLLGKIWTSKSCKGEGRPGRHAGGPARALCLQEGRCRVAMWGGVFRSNGAQLPKIKKAVRLCSVTGGPATESTGRRAGSPSTHTPAWPPPRWPYYHGELGELHAEVTPSGSQR